MTKKWKQKWNALIHHRFFRSKACERLILCLLAYTLTIGFGCVIFGELTETGWLLIPGLFPGFIMIFLYWHYRPIDPGQVPERFDSSLENAEDIRVCCKAWMEENKYSQIYHDTLLGCQVYWGYRYRKHNAYIAELLVVIEYEQYMEEQEIAILEEIYNRMLGEIKKNPLYLNSKTIVVNCIKNRQSTLTKALYKQAEVGLEAILLLRCGYTQQDKSFRIQRIWDSAFNNQRMLKKARKQVLSIFVGKLTPVQEKQKR